MAWFAVKSQKTSRIVLGFISRELTQYKGDMCFNKTYTPKI